MGRPREHDQDVGEALLDAAMALLAQRGPEAVSVRAVADAVGTTTRAVYSVFGSKSGLVLGVAARSYRMLAERVRAIPVTDDPAADLVAVGIEGFRGFAIEHPQLFRLTFERVPSEIVADPSVAREALSSYEALVTVVERGKDAGVLVDRPTLEIVFGFHALCLGLANGELSREPAPVGSEFWTPAHGYDAERLWRTAVEAFVAGLTVMPA